MAHTKSIVNVAAWSALLFTLWALAALTAFALATGVRS